MATPDQTYEQRVTFFYLRRAFEYTTSHKSNLSKHFYRRDDFSRR